jgi:hypothetical protein
MLRAAVHPEHLACHSELARNDILGWNDGRGERGRIMVNLPTIELYSDIH